MLSMDNKMIADILSKHMTGEQLTPDEKNIWVSGLTQARKIGRNLIS